jgi:tetratricopeptide (TPR) repeat protein
MRIHNWLLLAPILFILSCKSGEKLYNQGRYDEAVLLFVKKLQKKPHDATSLTLLPKAYAQSQQQHDSRATSILASNNTLKWEQVKAEYNAMQRLYVAIHASPAALEVVTPKNYSNAITGASENAAEARYAEGLHFLNAGDKASARRAFDDFQAALSLSPHYKDAEQMSQDAWNEGVVNVVISEIGVRSPYYQFSADQFHTQLIRNLQSRNINRFVRFYDEGQAQSDNIRADEYLTLNFYDFVVGQTYVDRDQREVSREVVTGSVKDTSGRTINRYSTVKASLFFVKATVVSKGLLDYSLIDVPTNKVLRQDRLPGSYTWINQYAYFKGDERALNDDDKKLMGGSDLKPPPPQDLFMLFTKPIYDQLTSDMQVIYNNL